MFMFNRQIKQPVNDFHLVLIFNILEMPTIDALRLAQLHNHIDKMKHDVSTREKVSAKTRHEKLWTCPHKLGLGQVANPSHPFRPNTSKHFTFLIY